MVGNPTITEAGTASGNPFLQDWDTPFRLPAFDRVEPGDFRPAFDAALAAHREEIAAIADSDAAPEFVNTVEALERSGAMLRRVSSVFFALTGADTNDELQAIEREISPRLARHRTAMYLNEALFARIDDLWARRDSLELDDEQARVLERYHTAFTRSGAGLSAGAKARLAEIAERLATLGTQFAQNVLADEKGYRLVLESEEDLAGLPDFVRDAAADAASARGLDGKHVVTLSRSSIEPFLQFSARRDLREQAFRAWASRGEGGGETDNTAIMAEMVGLRAEKAKLLGYDSFAAFRLADEMAKTPDAALGLLRSVWGPARARAIEEAGALQALAAAEGGNFEIAPWDWRYYAEKRRKAEFDLDEEEIKPFFQLDRMIEAAFHTANRLFGLTFAERPDLKGYHPDVRVFEVSDADGGHVGLFLGDYFARPSKRSGAWMGQIRPQHKLDGEVRPIVVNVMNFSKASGSAPTLLSFDDARTLFHEFGHALHGLLSDVTYPAISGTSVSRDFVEFPSQLFEHWLEEPQVLKRFAVHYRTGTGDAGRAVRPAGRGAQLQPGLRDERISRLGDRRSRAAPEARRRRHRLRRVRAGLARRARHAGRDRAAPPPAALRPRLRRRRLLRRLLQLHVVGGARFGRLRGLRGGGRPVRPGARQAAQGVRLFRGLPARPGRGLPGLPRPHAGAGRAPQAARPDGAGPGGGLKGETRGASLSRCAAQRRAPRRRPRRRSVPSRGPTSA